MVRELLPTVAVLDNRPLVMTVVGEIFRSFSAMIRARGFSNLDDLKSYAPQAKLLLINPFAIPSLSAAEVINEVVDVVSDRRILLTTHIEALLPFKHELKVPLDFRWFDLRTEPQAVYRIIHQMCQDLGLLQLGHSDQNTEQPVF